MVLSIETYKRDCLTDLRRAVVEHNNHTEWFVRDDVVKPVKPTEVLMSLPEDCERHILDYSGHNDEYETNYLNWIFETIYRINNRYTSFFCNVKRHFRYFDAHTKVLLKWKGEGRDIIKAMLKKQIDELTAVYNEI
jgi:hypothetical protein